MTVQTAPLSMRERWNNRAVIHLLWPLVIEQLLSVTIGMVDTLMMSTVGEYAVSGVSLVDAIATLLIIAFGALATGGAVVISQYLGRGDAQNANTAAKQLVYTSVITACFIMVGALIFRNHLLTLIYGNIESEVLAAAETYFLYGALSYPALALYNACAALFRSMGNSRITMLVSLLMNVVHVIGCVALIFGLNLGVAGTALSTLVSRSLGALILLLLLMKGKKQTISLTGLFHIKFQKHLIGSILHVGIPSGIENSLFQLGKILVSRFVTVFGTAAIAANAVTGEINSFIFMPGNAFGLALLTIVGQCIGAKDYEAARYFTKKILLWTYVVMGIASIFSVVFVHPLVGLFSNLEPSAHDMTVLFLHILCIGQITVWPTSFTLPNALRAAGDVKYVMVVAIISMWLIRVLGGYIFTFTLGFGAIGIWYAWIADWVFRSAFFVPRWISGKWQEKKILKD